MSVFPRRTSSVLFLMAIAATPLMFVGCGGTAGNGGNNVNGSGGGSGGGSGDVGSLSVVATEAALDSVAWIVAGQDIIAFSTPDGSGVGYIKPAAGDTTAREISNTETFQNVGFAVAGNWIAMKNSDGDAFIFDADTEELTQFDRADLNISGATAGQAKFWAAGDYIATLTNPGEVADGAAIKVIDLSSGAPELISFTNPIVDVDPARENEVWQLAIDADAKQVVAQVADNLVLYDIDNPSAEPQVLDLADVGGISNRTQIWLDDGFVIYHDRDGTNNRKEITRLANFNDGTTTQLSSNPSASEDLILVNGVFAYFLNTSDDDTITNQQVRSVFGTVDGPTITFESGTDDVIGEERDDGLLGYGQTVAITPNGDFWFIAGDGSVAVAEYLQVSTGGSFATLSDPQGLDENGTQAARVHTSATYCAFRLSDDTLGYIDLP